MKFKILNRWSGDCQVEAEIDCSETALPSIKLGLAVKWAYLRGAVLRGAVLRGAPAIPALDSKILAAIEAGAKLDMCSWHSCETTHCRAGWAITLAGDEGRKLEIEYGSAAAGAMIYAKSYPDLRIPNFYASDAEAMEDIRARAAKDIRAAE